MTADDDRPLVTAVVPAYRAADTLGSTLTGLLTQVDVDLEIVVVDDGSDDRTAQVAQAYGDRVRLVHQDNAGVSAARNTGAREARGEFLVFCDSDDVLLPPAVSAMLERYRTAGGGRRLVTCNAYPLTPEGINPRRALVLNSFPPPAQQRRAILATNVVCTIVLVPAVLFAELGGYDESLAVAEDWELWLRAVYAGVEIVFEERPLALYRWRPGSLSSDGDRMLAGEDEVFARFAARTDLDLSPDERALLVERVERGSPWRSRRAADAALRAGDTRAAARDYRRAASLIPGDRRLQLRAASLTLLPVSARWWRRRDEGIAAATGLDESGPGAGHTFGASRPE